MSKFFDRRSPELIEFIGTQPVFCRHRGAARPHQSVAERHGYLPRFG